jgi:uncharacterized membrane protein
MKARPFPASEQWVCAAVLFLAAVLLLALKKIYRLPVLYYPFLVAAAATGTCVAGIAVRAGRLGRYSQALAGSRRAPLFLLSAVAALYFAVFSILSISRHEAFTTRMYDFGDMDQAIYNASKGHGLENTYQVFPYENKTRLATHVEPVYFLVAALYRFFPQPSLLFLIQTAAIVAGMLLLFFIAVHHGFGHWKSLAAAVIYALYPALQHMNLFDFHADVLAVPWLLSAYLAYAKRTPALYWCCIFCALMCKEYAGLAVGGMGLSLLLYHRDVRTGTLTMASGFGYFFLALLVINPFFNMGDQTVLLGLLFPEVGGRGGVWGVALYCLTHPLVTAARIFSEVNLEGIFYLLFPMAFVPLAAPWLLVGALPVLAKDVFTGIDVGTHREACAVPMLVISFVYGARKLELWCRAHPQWIAPGAVFRFALVCALLSAWAFGPSPLGHRFWAERYKYTAPPRAALYREFLAQVPAAAAVSASDCFTAHLSHRRYCYVFPQPFSPLSDAARRVDMVLIDTLAGDVPRCRCDALSLLTNLGFTLRSGRAGVFLFVRSATGK